jgi:large subunit ribosomal protein L23
MNSNDIILRPVISEKSTSLMDQSKYVFQVSFKANKLMIKRAVNELFGVKAEKINIVLVRGKKKRVRYRVGRTSAWKKAVVTLQPGKKIEIFDTK